MGQSEEEENVSFMRSQVLRLINERSRISTLELAKELKCDHQRIVGLIKSLESMDILVVEQCELRRAELTKEGQLVAEHGSHEARVFNAIPADTGIPQQQLIGAFGDATIGKVGFSKAMSNGWILLDKDTKLVKRKVASINDQLHALTNSLKELKLDDQGLDDKTRTELKKRKLINDTVVKYMVVSKGQNFSLTIELPETDLTAPLIQSGVWRNKQFKPYNYNAFGVPVSCGHLHPLLKVREQFHQIFLEMGFAEMPTNNFVESSFWNFDVLFVPQAHPARDSQDTFFIKYPQQCDKMLDKQFIERVRRSHFGSGSLAWPRGYQYDWSQDESSKNVLRTHTTAVTARMLYQLAQDYHKDPNPNKTFKPAKLFSIDRVFRNETLDATHLAEFNQVEGVVVDIGLTLGDLMGVLKAFFTKLGIKRLRFKPAYNPYTEPSMEVFSYHEGLKKWVEVGNSGMFRPEMLHCLGLPENVTAIAWGLSLERPTMIKYKIDNIRHLVGHKIDLQMVYNSPICMF